MKRKDRKTEVVKLLEQFIAIESVSADSKRLSEVVNAAAFLKKTLHEMGFEVKHFEHGSAPPLVIASYTVKNAEHTIGIYGHYDVQAEDPVPEWNTAAYTLIEQKGKYWARGIADNKGHIIQNITAIDDLIAENKLKSNIVFIIEGEEETGSVHFEPFVKEAEDILKNVDIFYITDTGMYSKEKPQIFYALRGLLYFELQITTGKRDLHSGMYGNTVPNPALILAELLGKMKDNTTGEVLIPGFYDNVRTLDPREMSLLEQITRSDTELKAEAQSKSVQGLRGISPYLSSKILPSLDINGMVSGYIGEGPKTIIPRSATVKFSCRLVEHQEPEKVKKLIEEFISNTIPDSVDYEIKLMSSDAPFYTDINNNLVQKTGSILEQEFNSPIIYNRSGGSIPAAEILQRIFHKPIILTGFTLPDDNIHSPNENMDVELFWKGIEVLKIIYSNIFI